MTTTALHIQTYRVTTAKGVLTVEARQPVADRGSLLNPHPVQFVAGLVVQAEGRPWPIEINLPWPTIQDVIENIEAYMDEQLPIQAPAQITAQFKRMKAGESIIQQVRKG